MSIGDDFADRDDRWMAEQEAYEARYPTVHDEDEFDCITHDMRQQDHDKLLGGMNVALQTWRLGRFALDLRPLWRWGRGAPGMFFLGRLSVRWHR